MAEHSLFWDGTALGDCGPYTQADMMDRLYRAVLNGTGNRGVLYGWLNNLVVTGTLSPVSMATGGAIVYGMFYEADAPVTVSVPTPTVSSRTDLIVLRRDWATQQIRVARVSGPGAALTQNPGTIYEVPLASVIITTAGAVTVTDTREFVTYSTIYPALSITAGMYATGAVTAAKIPDRIRYELKGAGQIEPDNTNPCTWTAGASYNYWAFSNAAMNQAWAYFMAPTGLVGNVDLYIWSVPDTNGAAGEDCQWDYLAYYGSSGGALANVSGPCLVSQVGRLNTTIYRDLLLAGLVAGTGQIIAVQVGRNGGVGFDDYPHPMRLLGIEMYFTADA
jgi:hypothetical protein